MNVMWAVVGAVLGLAAGGALRATVFRLSVAPGEPERMACPRCDAPVRRRLAVRCGQCGCSLGTPLALELSTAVVLALLLGRFGAQPDVVAFGFFGVVGVALAAIDVATRRLPDPRTRPAYPILIALLAVAALASHDFSALARALLGGLALGGAYLVLALLRPGQIGGGGIKISGVSGL